MIKNIIKNLYIIFLCFSRAVFYGKADKKVETPKKVLIVQMAKLGDMICTTPMFRAIKKHYPKCLVYVMGDKVNKDVLDQNKDVDHYFIHAKNIFKNIKLLKKENIDFACITSPSFINLAMLYLSGIKLISAPIIENGFSPYETKSYKFLRKLAVLKTHHMGSYASREYLKLLEVLSIHESETKKYLNFSKEAMPMVDNFFTKNGIDIKKDFLVCMSPSAGNKIKLWGAEKFARVADFLYKKYQAKIIIIGVERDRIEVEEMIKNLNEDTKIISALNVFNIDELKAFISRVNLFIAVDTGPIYIAEAFGVPTIDITGPIDEKEQPPISDINKIVKIENRKGPQLHVMNARVYDEEEAKRQTDEISAKMVIEKVDELIAIIKKPK